MKQKIQNSNQFEAKYLKIDYQLIILFLIAQVSYAKEQTLKQHSLFYIS